MRRKTYPILEFDPTPHAVIEPRRLIAAADVPQHCVICFFQEVIDRLCESGQAREIYAMRSEMGAHPLYELAVQGRRLGVFHPGLGGPLAAGLLEEVIAFGCRKFVVCGGAGVLQKDIAVGHLIVVAAAVRDEGTSYHYLPPEREVAAEPGVVAVLQSALQRRGVPHLTGKTWTTDGPYRETRALVAQRRAEGCLTVEMEAAALLAVAQYRGALLGQVLYGGDDLSGSAWDNRGWQSRREVREHLFWLAAEACLEL